MNEFASVLVRVDNAANGPVLRITDPATGQSIGLDPLELQALAWCRHDQLDELLAPAFKERRLAELQASGEIDDFDEASLETPRQGEVP